MLRIIELFAGIGACSKALERLNIEHEIVDAVEIDKYAIKSFNAIHNTNFEVQDITKWDKNFENIDLIMHGSPCQDFSVAGKQAGGDLGSGTRSSLLYETIRIVGKLRPKYVVWENVKNLLSKAHKHNFDNYIETMNILGYNSYYQVLNAKDYGIPQNRERIYTISIRKDIDNGNFKFPQKEELKIRLKDILENEVDEKYYLKDYQIENIKKSNYIQNQRRIQEKDYCDTLCARDWKDPKCIQVAELDIRGWHDQMKRIYSSKGICPTLTTMGGGNTEPKIIENNLAAKHQQELIQDEEGISRCIPAGTHGSTPHLLKTVVRTPLKFLNRNQKKIQGDYAFCVDSCNTGGIKEISVIGNYMLSNHNASRVVDSNGLAPTVKENHGTVTATNVIIGSTQKHATISKNGIVPTLTSAMGQGGGHIPMHNYNVRIRKLTPKECWRLMGFDDEDFEKAQNIPTSNTQLYKQARKFYRCKCVRKNI